jgi:hypothetical protein
MMRVEDSDRIDELVRNAMPAVPPGKDERINDLLYGLAVDVVGEQPARTRVGRGGAVVWWRRRLLIAPLAAGAVLLSAAAGFAVWHDSTSPDFERAVTRYTSELALPPGTDRAAYVALLRDQGQQAPFSVSDLGVESTVSYYGVCAWLTAWDRRHAAGDGAGAAQAVTALRRAVDAPSLEATDGGGTMENLRQVVAAADRGDRSRVERELDNNCVGLPLDGVR